MSYLRALLKVALFVFLILAGGIAIYTYSFGEDIKNFLIKEINQQLLVETKVKEVDINLWKSFPDLSLILGDIEMIDEENTFISAEEILIKFSLLDLIDKNYTLHALEIKNGKLILKENQEGRYFPRIWKSTIGEKEEEKEFKLELEKIDLQDLLVHYEQRDKQIGFDIDISTARGKGKFGSDDYEFSWVSDISEFDYRRKGTTTLTERDFELEAICQIQNAQKRMTIRRLVLDWQDLEVEANGTLDYRDQLLTEINFKKEKGALQNVLALLREENRRRVDSLNPQGDISINGQLKGQLSPSFKPSVIINYRVENGQLSNILNKIELREISYDGSFESSNLSQIQKGLIKLDSIKAKVNNCDFNGQAYWTPGSTESLYLKGKINGELVELNSFISDSTSFNDGSFVAELDLELPMTKSNGSLLKNWKKKNNSIYFSIENAEIMRGGKSLLRDLELQAALGRNDLYAKKISFDYENSNFLFNGKLLNMISFFDDSNETLVVDGVLNTTSIRLEEVFELFSNNGDNGKERKVQAYLNCTAESLAYKKLLMNEVSFDLRYYKRQVELSNIQLKTLNGSASGRLIYNAQAGKNQLQVESEFNDIDIHELFVSLENFDQEMITASNLYGKASGLSNLELSFDNNSEVDLSSILLNGFYDIQDGRLLNYEPLYKLSKYIELEELEEIEFERLQNQIRIANQKIFIPRFQIRSSAIDIEMEGTHSFDNVVDYRFSLLLSEVLGKKAKKPKESEFGYIEDDGLGRTQLFLKMTGNIDDPDIKYDRQQLGKHWKKEAQAEKQEIKSILKEEFGLFKKDSTLKSPNEPAEKDRPLFQIEWDEDPSSKEEKAVKTEEVEEKKNKKKGKFGKFIDKIAKPNEEEYVSPQDK